MLNGRQIILRGSIKVALEELEDKDRLHELRNLQCVINFMIEQLEKRLDYDDGQGEEI